MFSGLLLGGGNIHTLAHERHGHHTLGLVCPRAQSAFFEFLYARCNLGRVGPVSRQSPIRQDYGERRGLAVLAHSGNCQAFDSLSEL